jgi:hypothetical protein
MAQIAFDLTPYNPETLRDELRAAVGAVEGVSNSTGKLWVAFLPYTSLEVMESHRETLQAVIDSHDPSPLSERQQARKEAEETRAALVGIIANRIAWHEANPVNPGNAVDVAGRMQTELIYIMKWIRKDLID